MYNEFLLDFFDDIYNGIGDFLTAKKIKLPK
jgi:hypothetical protein